MAITIKLRSPRYPAVGLKEALAKVRLVYDKDHRNPLPKEVVAEHMGYGSLNGSSLGVIAAASKYGLLEGARDAIRVAPRAVAVFVHAPGSPERVKAVSDAAAEPELFQELDQRFEGRASDAAIRSYLISQRSFLPAAADTLIRVYRETKSFVAEESSAPYDSSPDEQRAGTTEGVMQAATLAMPTAAPPQPLPGLGRKLQVVLSDEGVEVQASIRDVATLRKLIRMLQANEATLRELEDDIEDGELADAAE